MTTRSLILAAETLVPAPWQDVAPFRCFNPALLAHADEWILAYRMVGRDGLRRIAMCRLDRMLMVVPGSPIALSDHLAPLLSEALAERARQWFADPRLFILDGRLFVHWNSGWHAPHNHQFVQELDQQTLLPCGQPRELLREGARQPVEKNWTFVDSGGIHAIYAPDPHEVMSMIDDTPTRWLFRPSSSQPSTREDFRVRYGALRGGAPPIRYGRALLSLCHMVYPTPLGYDYAAAAYLFASEPPFAPIAVPHRPLRLERTTIASCAAPLNPAVHHVVYPGGAARRDGFIHISYGIDDAHCAIARVPEEEVEATLHPIRNSAARPSYREASI